MILTIKDLHEEIYKNIYSIYNIFQNFFTLEHVDLQNIKSYEDLYQIILDNSDEARTDYENIETVKVALTKTQIDTIKELIPSADILVWFPTVKITNEHNRCIYITDLYAKIKITCTGNIPYEYSGFLLNRASYSETQFNCDYMHSHINHIPTSDFTKFQTPCLGSGPIKKTIQSLKTVYDDTLWMLFCRELSMYVTVESLKGIPYHRLEHVTPSTTKLYKVEYCNFKDNTASYYIGLLLDTLGSENLHNFIAYYINNTKLDFNFINDEFTCKQTFYEYRIELSNLFIKYYNEYLTEIDYKELILKDVLCCVFIKDYKFFVPKNGKFSINASFYEGKPVCKFKGKNITLSISNIDNSNQNKESIVLSCSICKALLLRILKVLNYNFIYAKNNGEELSTTCERTCYL